MGRPRSSQKSKAGAKKSLKIARPIYSERALVELPLAQEQERGDSLHALSLMRTKGYSLTRAAREVDLTRTAVRQWVGRSITKRGRRYAARPSDRLVRVMKVITERGDKAVPVYDSRVASRLGSYHAAVREALRGNLAALKPYRRKSLRTGGKRGYPFITDIRVLKRLANAGALPEYQIYGSHLG